MINTRRAHYEAACYSNRDLMVALKGFDIDKFLARPHRPIVLVFGPDAGLARERAEALVRMSVDDPKDPFQLARLDGDDLAGEPTRLVEEANTIPLFGGRRAVWVKAGARNFAPALDALIADPPSDCRIVIEAGDRWLSRCRVRGAHRRAGNPVRQGTHGRHGTGHDPGSGAAARSAIAQSETFHR